MNIDKVKQFNKLTQKKQDLQAELDAVKASLAALDIELQDEFASDGIDKITVGGRTVFVGSMIWAKIGKGNRDKVTEVLRNCPETQSLVQEGFNAVRLSAFIREKIKAGEPLPPSFNGVIDWVENFQVKSTAAGS